jgi:hypothetical protein
LAIGNGHAPGIEIGCGATGAAAAFFGAAERFGAGFFLAAGCVFFRAAGLRAGRDFPTTDFFFFAAGFFAARFFAAVFFFAGFRFFALAISCLL